MDISEIIVKLSADIGSFINDMDIAIGKIHELKGAGTNDVNDLNGAFTNINGILTFIGVIGTIGALIVGLGAIIGGTFGILIAAAATIVAIFLSLNVIFYAVAEKLGLVNAACGYFGEWAKLMFGPIGAFMFLWDNWADILENIHRLLKDISTFNISDMFSPASGKLGEDTPFRQGLKDFVSDKSSNIPRTIPPDDPFNKNSHSNTTSDSGSPATGKKGGCFIAKTPIMMLDKSEKPIEEIEPGDQVLSYDPTTMEFKPGLVTKKIIHTSNEQLSLVFSDNRTIITTTEHPFHAIKTASKCRIHGSFIPAGELSPGDTVLYLCGDTIQEVTVSKISKIRDDTTVYNFNVEPYHTYVAGGCLVHNVKTVAMAEGGIVTNPIFGIIGEAGPEAVLPLSNLRSLLNGSGSQTITIETPVYLDSDKIGEALTRQIRLREGI
jgi:hypothetical protein